MQQPKDLDHHIHDKAIGYTIDKMFKEQNSMFTWFVQKLEIYKVKQKTRQQHKFPIRINLKLNFVAIQKNTNRRDMHIQIQKFIRKETEINNNLSLL
jgi:hypothetical protein